MPLEHDKDPVTPDPRRHLRLVPDPDAPARASGRRFNNVPRIGDADSSLDPLPDSVYDGMACAAELWQSLHDDGKQLHYVLDELTGDVSVELRDLDGRSLRSVSLVDALGAAADDSSAA